MRRLAALVNIDHRVVIVRCKGEPQFPVFHFREKGIIANTCAARCFDCERQLVEGVVSVRPHELDAAERKTLVSVFPSVESGAKHHRVTDVLGILDLESKYVIGFL